MIFNNYSKPELEHWGQRCSIIYQWISSQNRIINRIHRIHLLSNDMLLIIAGGRMFDNSVAYYDDGTLIHFPEQKHEEIIFIKTPPDLSHYRRCGYYNPGESKLTTTDKDFIIDYIVENSG